MYVWFLFGLHWLSSKLTELYFVDLSYRRILAVENQLQIYQGLC